SDTVTIVSGAAGSQSVAVTLTVTAAASPTPTGTLVAHWTFDSPAVVNNTALDSSGNDLYGTLSGNATLFPGKLGQALSLDGSTAYMYASPDERLRLAQDLTLAAWIKTQNTSRTETVISKYNSSGSEDGYIVETTPDGYLTLHLGGQNIAGNRDILEGTNKINDGEWHHIAVIIRPAQDVMFYIDGGLSSVDYLTTAGGAAGSGFGIGNPTYLSNFFTGGIDDVRVYTRALTSAEIAQLFGGPVTTVAGGERLSNGVVMPKNFPPPTLPTQMQRTPYYLNNPPLVLPINVGRQLFVDDFLIDHTTLDRTPHRPVIQPIPVLTPGSPISAGAWFDPATQLYKLWYYNLTNDYRYAYSNDGVNWTLPSLADGLVPGTNEVVPGGDTIWLDAEDTNPARRYKSFGVDAGAGKVYVYFSADGIHWTPKQDFGITTLSDRTTVFWNPFRHVWVNSDRGSAALPATPSRAAQSSRGRFYSESKDLTTWTPSDPSKTYWTGADDQDPPYYG
ncbi:MAG: LamG domain-containing protein, partial [Bryobacteraceae bacterium]